MDCKPSIVEFFSIILVDLQLKEAFAWVDKQPILTWLPSLLISLIIFRGLLAFSEVLLFRF